MVDLIPFIDLELFVAAALTIGASIIAIESKDLVRGAFALAASFLGNAFIFALLDAPFVALFQIIVYIGAIAVLILFTVMLVKREKWLATSENIRILPAVFASSLLFIGFIAISVLSGLFDWFPNTNFDITFNLIGVNLMLDFWPILLILSGVLASALFSSIYHAKLEKDH